MQYIPYNQFPSSKTFSICTAKQEVELGLCTATSNKVRKVPAEVEAHSSLVTVPAEFTPPTLAELAAVDESPSTGKVSTEPAKGDKVDAPPALAELAAVDESPPSGNVPKEPAMRDE